jgi:hypothetical protein
VCVCVCVCVYREIDLRQCLVLPASMPYVKNAVRYIMFKACSIV